MDVYAPTRVDILLRRQTEYLMRQLKHARAHIRISNATFESPNHSHSEIRFILQNEWKEWDAYFITSQVDLDKNVHIQYILQRIDEDQDVLIANGGAYAPTELLTRTDDKCEKYFATAVFNVMHYIYTTSYRENIFDWCISELRLWLNNMDQMLG